jgi:diacylglycerol O-acyltransferase / wax synthase
MSTTHLSALDASFLEVESPSAHMHVGWAAVLDPPRDGSAPGFDRLTEHIRGRLRRAPRFRQMLRPVPFGLSTPRWVDDPGFDLSRHLIEARSGQLSEIVDACMSQKLRRDRPLWQMWVAPRLRDGRVGLVAKLHHCMVDGIAAVELGSLLLDPEPEPPPPQPDEWEPTPGPSALGLVATGALDLARDQLKLASIPARVAASPRRARGLVARGGRAFAALADSARPARISAALNPPISPRRHLGRIERPVDDLLEIKRSLGVTLNDVVLAAVTSGVRRWIADRGERPMTVKAMVPVNVRDDGDDELLGNRISFMFVDLPCEEPDPIRRLRHLHAETDERKRRGIPDGAGDVLDLFSLSPPPVQRLVSRLLASPRAFNLVVSNIPGPPEAAYICGCRLREAYPVVPIADQHALSVGFTTIADRACFGLYADPAALPDVDELAACIDAAIEELRDVAVLRPISRQAAFA